MNAPQFQIGEIAILLYGCNCGLCYGSGEECEIIGGLELRTFRMSLFGPLVTEPAYLVSVRGGLIKGAARPQDLRKKRPPGERRTDVDSDASPNTPSTFDPAIWSPAKEVA